MNKKILGALVALSLFGGLSFYIYALTNNKIVIGYNNGYAPDQPLEFSHEVHVGKYKMDCKFCHTSVEVSRHASVPSLNVCMNCHLLVRANDSEKIKALAAAYNSDKPIAWQKVNLLPDHVKFNHSAHIKAGKDCATCHGPVETMSKVFQIQSFSMGFCVNCHRLPENNAPVNCSTCHY